jgi:hypothetical protein
MDSLRAGIRYLSGTPVFRARVRTRGAPFDLKSGKLYVNAIVADVFDFPRDDGNHAVLISIAPKQACGIAIFIDGVLKAEANCLSMSNHWAGPGHGGAYGISGPDQFGAMGESANAWPTPLGPLNL